MFWKQKVRNHWLKEGDKNTKYFHLSTLAHRAMNQITSLRNAEGHTLSSMEELDEHIISFFQNLLQEEEIDREATQSYFENLIPPTLSSDHNAILLAPISEEEVEHAVFQMKSFGAPGPDGFPPGFYQHFWYLLRDEVVGFVRESFESK